MDFLDAESSRFEKKAAERKILALKKKQALQRKNETTKNSGLKLAEFQLQRKLIEGAKVKVMNAVESYEYGLNYSQDVGVKFEGDLMPVCVTGKGDKITLPQSVLSTTFSSSAVTSGPMCFRLAIGPEKSEGEFNLGNDINWVEFVKEAEAKAGEEATGDGDSGGLVDSDSDSDSDSDGDGDGDGESGSDRDEMADGTTKGEKKLPRKALNKAIMSMVNPARFRAVTYGGIVEFTAEENTVGIPKRVAESLLRGLRSDNDDPRLQPTVEDEETTGQEITDEKAKFQLPDFPINVRLVSLPKGKSTVLAPTKSAVVNGFSKLSDIKLVLEQSLGRTRTTLSVGDEISAWWRGKEFVLTCESVEPDNVGGICLIDTDVEVNISYENIERDEDNVVKKEERVGALSARQATTPAQDGATQDVSQGATTPAVKPAPSYLSSPLPDNDFPATPDTTTILFRLPSSGKSTLTVPRTTTLSSLYAHVHLRILNNASNDEFKLVGQFPRKIYEPGEGTGQEAGWGKREVLVVEMCK